MATRHVTYEFDWGYGTYDRNTEQAAINEIEAAQEYLNKFDVNIQERELIDDTTTTNVTYIGKAVPTGAAIPTSSAVWQITCIDESSSPTTVKYADGDLLFDNTFQSLGSKNYY